MYNNSNGISKNAFLNGEGAASNIYFIHARLGGTFAHPGVVGGELFCLLALVVLAVQAGAGRVSLHLRTGGGGVRPYTVWPLYSHLMGVKGGCGGGHCGGRALCRENNNASHVDNDRLLLPFLA